MRRSLVAAALTASLLAGPAQLFHPLWDLLSSLWSGVTEKAGGGADPNGLQAPAPPPPTTDAGGGWDPNG